eukprot:1467100-Lingulodinium_polyedra.AAC.1
MFISDINAFKCSMYFGEADDVMPTKCLPSTRRSALGGLVRLTSLILPETAGAAFCACRSVLTALLEHGTE